MDLYSVKLVHASERLAAKALDHADAILSPAKKRLDDNRAIVAAFVESLDGLSWSTPPAGSVGLVYWGGADG